MAHTKRPQPKKQGRGPSKAAAPSAAPTASVNAAKLKDFYVRLASDLDLLSDFIADSQAVAKRELGEAEREILFSGNQGLIYSTLRPDLVSKAPPAPPPPQPAQPAAQQPAQYAHPVTTSAFPVSPVTVYYMAHGAPGAQPVMPSPAGSEYPALPPQHIYNVPPMVYLYGGYHTAGYPYWPGWPPYPQQ